jgi:hypothetical protein
MGDIVISADTRALQELGRRLKRMDKPLQKAIRKTLTTETRKVVKAVRQEILDIPVQGKPSAPYKAPKRHKPGFIGPLQSGERNVRQNMARGVRSAIRYGNARGEVKIAVVGSSHFLPPEKKVLNKVLNFPSWRHPVFGNQDVWVVQEGHPFWAKTTIRFKDAIHNALVQAVEQSIVEELKSKPIGM